MDKKAAISRFDQAISMLPVRWRSTMLSLSDGKKEIAEEIRLRVGEPITVLLPEGETTVAVDKMTVNASDIEQLCELVTEFSRYASGETMAQGFIMAQGGFRVGICGTAVMENGVSRNMHHLSSASIRIVREKCGIAEPLLGELLENGRFLSTIVVAPPGGGKTTLLRDLVRLLSDGAENRQPYRVGLVDERGELAGVYRGIAQLDVGSHTDVLDGCPKAQGIMILLRAMNPQIIAVDEITAREDLAAMGQAANCGVSVLASIHASQMGELKRKPLFQQLLRQRVFSRAVIISREEDGTRSYRVEKLA